MPAKPCCITLDLENNWQPSDSSIDYETFEHLPEFCDLVTDLEVPLSVYVVGEVLEDRPDAVETVRSQVDSEFHVHSYAHDLEGSTDFERDVDRAISTYRDYFGRKPVGYRSPMGRIDGGQLRHLESRGFEFDSSVFPTYRPGVFNNITASLDPYVPDSCTDLVELPIGCVRGLRLPLVQSYLKFVGRPSLWAVRHLPLPRVLTVVVHLQDLFRTEMHDRLDQPLRFIHGRNVERSHAMFRTLVTTLRNRGYRFVTARDVLDSASISPKEFTPKAEA